jgi:hypothetical protein
MGTCCHSVFECLLNPRHKKKFNKIIKKDASIKKCKVITRYIKWQMRKFNIPKENFDKIDSMIVMGLITDFFVKGAKLEAPELEFDIINKKPFYRIGGFIDKPAIKGDNFLIYDYKSSKQAFTEQELKTNIQAQIYSLAAKHLHPHLKPIVNFIFLAHNPPTRTIEFDDNEIKGLEKYLEEIYYKISNFTQKDFASNLAANKGFPKPEEGFCKRLMCGRAKSPNEKKKNGDPAWYCPQKFPYDYWALCNKDGKTIKSSLERKDLKPKIDDGGIYYKKTLSRLLGL